MAQRLSNLPVGARIKYGKHQINNETPWEIEWTIVAKNHQCVPAYPANAITLQTTKIIDMRCYDAKEPKNPDENRAYGGNSTYEFSNMHQWLNSKARAGAWYSESHGYDQAPDSTDVVSHGTHHASRPGFLWFFSDTEYDAILQTTIRCSNYRTEIAYDDITAKVFLASRTEVGFGVEHDYAEGEAWGYYTKNEERMANISTQVMYNTLSSDKPRAEYYYNYDKWPWWLRTADYSYSSSAPRRVQTTGDIDSSAPAYLGWMGVRPVINLSASTKVSDGTDSDGCYTVLWNTLPTAPATIDVPSTIFSGKSVNVSWGASSDADGNMLGYILERSYDGGEFVQVYKGSSRSYSDTVSKGNTSVQYRVCAYDDDEAKSSYTSSTARAIINNEAPAISGTNGNLGTKTDGFSQSYVVTDVDGGLVSVTEAIDGVALRSYAVTLDASQVFSVTGSTWLKLSNGSHTMTITAIDEYGETAVRTYTFEKAVYSFTVQNTSPYESSTKPIRIKLYVTRNIPDGADFKVYVCNNGFDASPVWEDATSAVEGGDAHVFENSAKTAGSWGVAVRVVVSRNGASGACYVSQIGGNFE